MNIISNKVNNAVSLEFKDKKTEAFAEYIGCILLSAQQLSQTRGLLAFQSSESNSAVSTDVSQLCHLARECINRIEAILKQDIEGLALGSHKSSIEEDEDEEDMMEGLRTIGNGHFGSASAIVSSSSSPLLVRTNDLESRLPSEEQLRFLLQQPLLDAQNKTKDLISKYSARVQKIKSSGMPIQAQSATLSDLSLAYSREYMENFEIAKAQQQAILQGIQERKAQEDELARQAALRDGKHVAGPLPRKKPFKSIRAMAANVRHTAQQQLHTVQQQLHRPRGPDSGWTSELASKGEDVERDFVVNYLMQSVFGSPSHPLGRAIVKMSDEFENQLPKMSAADLKKMNEASFAKCIESVRSFINSCASLVMNTFRELDTDVGTDAAFAAVEDFVYPRIYASLFQRFKHIYAAKDDMFDHQLQIFAGITPAHLGLKKKFWLTDAPVIPFQRNASVGFGPYHSAIAMLSLLPNAHTPGAKLHLIVSTSKEVVRCVENYWKTQEHSANDIDHDEEKQSVPADITIAADDLLPMMAYVVIKANVPHLHSESSLISELIDEQALLGEEGYCLSTFQMCLYYIESLDWVELDTQYRKTVEEFTGVAIS